MQYFCCVVEISQEFVEFLLAPWFLGIVVLSLAFLVDVLLIALGFGGGLVATVVLSINGDEEFIQLICYV